MADQHVPKTLKHRVVDYYDYLWLRNKGVVIKALLKDCPPCMKAEVALSITNTMLTSVSSLFTQPTHPFSFYWPTCFLVLGLPYNKYQCCTWCVAEYINENKQKRINKVSKQI